MAETPKKRVVLIAMDGSSYSDYAFDYYLRNIHKEEDFVLLVNCVEYLGIVNMRKNPVFSRCGSFEIGRNIQEPKQTAGYLVESGDYSYDAFGEAIGVRPDNNEAAEVGSASLVTEVVAEERRQADVYLNKLTEKMKANKLHGKVRQVHGHARAEILKVAEEEKAIMILTGTRGMGKVRRTLLGSVSDHILHHSHVPVLVCRHKDDHHHHGFFHHHHHHDQ